MFMRNRGGLGRNGFPGVIPRARRSKNSYFAWKAQRISSASPSRAERKRGLFRKPGGFEGLLGVAGDLGSHDLYVAHGEDDRLLKLRCHPAACSQTPLVVNGDHLISVVDKLVDHDLPLLERKRREPVLLKETPDFVVAAIDAEPGDLARGKVELDL